MSLIVLVLDIRKLAFRSILPFREINSDETFQVF